MNSAKTNILEHRPRLVLVFSFLGVNCWVKGWSAFYNLEILSFPPGPCQFPVHQPSWVISPHAPHHWILPGFAHLTSRTWLLVFIWIPLLVRLSIFCSGFVILFVILPRWFDVLCSLFIFLIPFLFRLEKWRQRSPNYRKNCLNKKRSCKTPWSFCSWASTRKKSSLISVSERLGAAAVLTTSCLWGPKSPPWTTRFEAQVVYHHAFCVWVSFHASSFWPTQTMDSLNVLLQRGHSMPGTVISLGDGAGHVQWQEHV